MAESMKKNEDFKLVYENGISYANKYLIMYLLKNSAGKNRIGFSVSKKVGNSVIRHRVKRQLREIIRLNEAKFHSGWNIVIIARTGAKQKSYEELYSAVMHLAKLHELV